MSITTILYRTAVTITAVAAATLGGAGLASAVTQPAPAHSTHRVTEDDPRWNCRTMGNRACGRTLPRWAHWKTAPRGACGQGSPGIVVWAGHGDGVLICPDGDVETS